VVCGKQHRIVKGILPLTLLWTLIACTYQQPLLKPAPGETPPPIEIKSETLVAVPDTPALEIPTPEPRFYIHKVRWTGETLTHIATWYTGTIKNWKAIANVNSELDPSKIHVGDTISIPEDLLTTHKPMPHSFVRLTVLKKRTSRSSLKKTSTPLESPKLFEPIDSEPPTIEIDSPELFGPVETEQSSIEPDAANLFGPIE
jgi:LysM repeat protein